MPTIPHKSQAVIPPAAWLLPALLLLVLFNFVGFFHWLLSVGLMFSVLWLRPGREWPAWYVSFGIASTAQHFLMSRSGYGSPGGWHAMQEPVSPVIGYWLQPLLCMAVLFWMRRLDFRPETATSLRGVALLHLAAALFALLLMVTDSVTIGVEGLAGATLQDGIIGMQTLRLPESLPLLLNFGLSHFMGGFLGIMLVVPMALWLLLPQNRPGSTRIIRSSLIYLYLLPMLLYLANKLLLSSGADLLGMLRTLVLVAVAAFSFLHGWRGAALSVLVASMLIALDDHLRGGTDIVELQLYVAVMGAMALLFGASVNELRQKERLLLVDRDRLQVALAALAESSRRSLHTEELERKRLARELHDEMGQTLTAMQTELSLADADSGASLRHMQQLTARLGRSLRSVVNALTPDELDQLGLYTAITYGSPAQMCEQAGIGYQVELYGDSQLLAQLDMLTNLAAYRIVQESVNNAIKHAHCDSIRVRMRIGRRDRRILLLLEIRDDGIGLTSLRQIAHGFNSIRDRAMALDGVLSIQNIPGVRVHVLLRQNSIELG